MSQSSFAEDRGPCRRAQLCIRRNGDRIGPGKIALLEAIQAEGSIASAARHLGMPYPREFLKEVRGAGGKRRRSLGDATIVHIARMDEKDGIFSPTTRKMGT